MSETNGANASPRPCTFAETAPPTQKSSAPVCFWRMAQGVPESASIKPRPLDASLDLSEAALLVERDDARESPRVEQDAVRAELLAAHRVPPAGDRDGPSGVSCPSERGPDSSTEPISAISPTVVSFSLRVDVVDARGHRTLGGTSSNGAIHARATHIPATKTAITSATATSASRFKCRTVELRDG